MKVLNALDLKNGAKADYQKSGSLTQPIQFLPKKDKDEEWAAWNMDWYEWQGIKQLKRNSRRILKNYKLAKGIIDKTDYIVEPDNEYADLVDTLIKEDESALEIKFYPIIPSVINVLIGEFAKRKNKVTFRAVDDISFNEMYEMKRSMIEETLFAEAEINLLTKLYEQGTDLNSEEVQKLRSRESLQSLPQIQDFFNKDYKSLVEEWAIHQLNVDEERFKLQELEERGFRDMLITDREFWHFKMNDDDYEIELWNPALTFYHKSPDIRYISQGNYVGKIDMMTVADVIDKYGYLLDEQQLKGLEAIYPVRSAGYAISGYQNDGTFYDATKSPEWNSMENGSLGYRQFMATHYSNYQNGDVLNSILGESEDMFDFADAFMLRVTTVYWKSQRKIGHLVKITEEGEVIQDIVDEDYVITEKPIYNKTFNKNKTKENLVFGEHIDWIWINETWGGVKIGPNHPSFWGQKNTSGVDPIYVGINKSKLGRLDFQFKGDSTLYGCKLPVEGAVFSDRNTKSVSLVDLMKPFQIGYNIVNNQISDILVDELGTVIMLDQNALPRHSLGEDWGKNNLAKAYVAMKDFQMLPLDTSITNTENALNFQHYQVLSLEQTNRLMGRVNLANYFKNQAFESIGVTPQRLGAQLTQETATGVQASLNASYSQTEIYFIQHSDYLMPRVHQMRTDLAQYYHSNKPSVRLQYVTNSAEKINFQINGTDLMLRDFNIFCTTKANHRQILEQLKQLAMTNNTTGATIFDLGNVVKAESISEVTEILKEAEQKQQQIKESEMQQMQQMKQAEIQARQQEAVMKMQFEASEADKDRQKDITVAEIRAAGYGAMVDINQNQVSDFQDALKDIRETERYNDQMNLKREQEISKRSMHNDKLGLEREKIQAQKEIADKQLQIARENKNRFDTPKGKK